MLNIGIVSQARIGSSRLPAKVLMNAGGRTLLEWHFDRLASSGYQSILATTTERLDDPLYEWACEAGVPVFRGSEDNVLLRYLDCARHFDLDVIVRVTSDCPLIDGELVAAGIRHYLAFDETRQYVTNGQHRTFPRGFDFEIFSFELLEEAYQRAVEPYEYEHVTPYFYHPAITRGAKNRSAKNRRANNSSAIDSDDSSGSSGGSQYRRMDIALRHFTQAEDHSHLRVTVDTIEDYELVRCLIEDYNASRCNHQQITEILNRNPELVAINHSIVQKQVV